MREQNQSPQPPKWATKLLEWLCPEELLEEVQGDLQELLEERAAEVGERQARKEYLLSVMGYLRPFAFKRKTNYSSTPLYMDMLFNYFLSFIRNFSRQKVNSFINVFGLSISIAFCLLIFLFTRDEFSFDRFYKNADRIYRLHRFHQTFKPVLEEPKGWLSKLKAKRENKNIVLSPLVGPRLQAEVPEVAQTLRYQITSGVFSNGKETFQEDIRYVDKNFFQFFSFPLLQGDAATVLADPSGIVITPAIAQKYFGQQNPVGKTLTYHQHGTTKTFVVKGLAEPAPATSSITFDILLPYENSPLLVAYSKEDLRFHYNTITFIELKQNASLLSLQRNLTSFVERLYEDQIIYLRKENKIPQGQPVYEYGITNIADTHFDNSVYWPKVSNPLYAYILLSIAGLIVLMACINYISLALAGTSGRIQEIGVRKMIGAHRRQIIFQLWIETHVLVLLAITLAIVLAYLFLPAFNYFTNKTLILEHLLQPQILIALLSLTLFIGVIAGGYPAIIISGFHPASILKNKSTYRINPWFSRILVVFQYSLCIFLVASTIIIYQQMNYISQKDLGYNTNQVLVISNYAEPGDATLRVMNKLKQQAAAHPEILAVSATSSVYGKGGMSLGYQINGKDVWVSKFDIDQDFIPAMALTMVQGRNFSADMGMEAESAIVNEALAALLGGNDIVGTIPKDLGAKVVGIVKDHHYGTLENKIGPAVFFNKPQKSSHFLLKISHRDIDRSVEIIQEIWKSVAPDQAFTYTFLEDEVASQYESYKKWSAIIGSATVFAICIAGLGLFGLTGLIALNRTKEVGIRKVLGASTKQIFLLINKNVIGLVFLSFVIAVPPAVYVMHGWLQDFAYRINISWYTFAAVGLVSWFVAFVSVSYYSIKAAMANPVNSLRNE